MSEVYQCLDAAGLKRLARNEPMSRHTSWKIGGPADYFCVVEDASCLLAAVHCAREHKLPWLVLGGGNNILVSDDGIAGVTILNRLRGIEISEENGVPIVLCGAGVFFAKAAQFTAQRGFTGMEWGISIPGTVGGGVVNNAGAHWSDVARSLVRATVVDETGETRTLGPDDLRYRYRQSALKSSHITQSRWVVTECAFRLQPDSPAAALERVDELRRHRLRTQPVKESSAGSTFKNPEGNYAGQLIDGAGLKGCSIGGAQISPLHANFILNLGGATASDVAALIRLARDAVRERFGITLETEVQFVGRWPAHILDAMLVAST